jgi:hypothetical protein
VRCVAPLPCSISLPCALFLSHGKESFAVRRRTAEYSGTATTVFPVVNDRCNWSHGRHITY